MREHECRDIVISAGSQSEVAMQPVSFLRSSMLLLPLLFTWALELAFRKALVRAIMLVSYLSYAQSLKRRIQVSKKDCATTEARGFFMTVMGTS